MDKTILEIDGSFGEAGGQILRTALGLSCLLNKPFRIFNIRKSRKKTGLMPQHLTSVRAFALISNAAVKGDSEGSTELMFAPSEVRPGDYFFDIGTAGSTSLLLQAILPPLFFARKRSSVTVKGGTHVPFSPPFHYISEVFVPMLEKLGLVLRASIERYGFYPKGGGKIHGEIIPEGDIKGIEFINRGEVRNIRGISGVGNLPLSIAERQKAAALKTLSPYALRCDIGTQQVAAYGHGTFLFLRAESDNCIAGFSSLGEIGKKAEMVGVEAAREFLDYYHTAACLDGHLADQIVLYLALAKKGSSFTVSRITNHLLTNLWVMGKFLQLKYEIEGEKGSPGKVTMST
jgi:RNA 3'-terminal phosphate cyclase (ATP)